VTELVVDMALSSSSRRRLPHLELRSMLRILQKQTSCHDLVVASALESS
jgi:hypothetical protein